MIGRYTSLIAGLALGAAVAAPLAYLIAWERAVAQERVAAVTATADLKEAVWRASQTLADVSATVEREEARDTMNLQEITHAAQSAGDVCFVDADRLRQLDAIGR